MDIFEIGEMVVEILENGEIKVRIEKKRNLIVIKKIGKDRKKMGKE